MTPCNRDSIIAAKKAELLGLTDCLELAKRYKESNENNGNFSCPSISPVMLELRKQVIDKIKAELLREMPEEMYDTQGYDTYAKGHNDYRDQILEVIEKVLI